jgi:hypothetical protein
MTPKSACSVIKERVERQKEKMRSSRYSEDQIIGILGSGRGQWTLEDTIQSNFPVGNTGSNPVGDATKSDFLRSTSTPIQAHAENSSRIPGRGRHYCASMRVHYFFANEKAETKASLTVLGVSFAH